MNELDGMAEALKSLSAKVSALDLTGAERNVLDTVLRRAALVDGEVSGFATGTDLSQLPKHEIGRLARFSPLAHDFTRALGVHIDPADFDGQAL